MARSDDLRQLVEAQTGRPKLMQVISFTNAAGTLTALAATDVYGFKVPTGATLLLEADQDFQYELRNTATAASQVTALGGSRPGKYVKALTAHQTMRHSDQATYGEDTKIDVIGATAAGSLSVFWVS